MSLILQPWGGGQLADLETYTAHVVEDDKVYLKPYLVVTTYKVPYQYTFNYRNSTGTTGYYTLKLGGNKIYDAEYGFRCLYNGNTRNNGISSFDLSCYRTNRINNMSEMFSYCDDLTSLNVSNFDTSNVTDMSSMFNRCSGLTSLDLSSFNTSKVTAMGFMFSGCTSLTSLDLSNFKTSKVTYMDYMFSGCPKLSRIKCKQAFKDWCIANQNTIKLPTIMREGGSGTWEIIG